MLACPDCNTKFPRPMNFCPTCGYQPPADPQAPPVTGATSYTTIIDPDKSRSSLINVLFVVCLVVLAAFIGYRLMSSSQRDQTSDSAPENSSYSSSETSSPPVPDEPKTAWVYSKTDDPMGRGQIGRASVESSNEVEFKFPYEGSQHATLVLRQHPAYGNSVILEIERGQFMAEITPTKLNVRFDDGPVETYYANAPTDDSTTMVFLKTNFSEFLNKVRASKTIDIEATFFEEGSRIFTFPSKGFEW